MTLVSNPAIIKVVKNSEAFKFKYGVIPTKQIGSPQGLKLMPNISMELTYLNKCPPPGDDSISHLSL